MVVVLVLLLLLLISPVLSDIVKFASVTNITMIKSTTKTDIFCITGGPQKSDFKLEDSFIIKSLLSDPEDKSVAKDVAEKIQNFYLGEKSNSSTAFSKATEVSNNFHFSSHTTKFSMSSNLGLLQ